MRTTSFLFFAALGIAACNDPTKGVAKAITGEAVTNTSSSSTKGGTVFTFDGSTSKIGWTGSKVTGKHDGGFGTFDGVVNLVEATPEKSSVVLDIDIASITSDGDRLVAHLKSADLFDVAKFAKAKFESTAVTKGGEKGASHTITGNLTLHGVTRSIRFPCNVALVGDAVNADATFAINRKDFGINYPGKAGDLIRDDVLIKLAIHAKKKPA